MELFPNALIDLLDAATDSTRQASEWLSAQTRYLVVVANEDLSKLPLLVVELGR